MNAPATPDEIREVNARYHDGAAVHYDAKWGIDWGEIGREQVMGKLRKALGSRTATFDRSLEVGSGTGYFSLHLLMAGVTLDATCTDISPGMIDALKANAERLDLKVDAQVADAEALPFENRSFDLVLGHAVLHHIPDLEKAFSEFYRVLRPGGLIVFAGEPSHYGDRIASVPKRIATAAAPAWRAVIGADKAPAGHSDGGEHNHELERHVDVHAFTPKTLSGFALGAGFEDVNVRGEELLANWFGWTNRALETTAVAEDVPMAWKRYAFHGYLALQKVDGAVLEPRLPASIFYNLLLAGRRPS